MVRFVLRPFPWQDWLVLFADFLNSVYLSQGEVKQIPKTFKTSWIFLISPISWCFALQKMRNGDYKRHFLILGVAFLALRCYLNSFARAQWLCTVYEKIPLVQLISWCSGGRRQFLLSSHFGQLIVGDTITLIQSQTSQFRSNDTELSKLMVFLPVKHSKIHFYVLSVLL